MTSTRARHRAPARPLHWASRSLVAAAAVPVGALTGCLAATAASVATAAPASPATGLAGATVVAVPLAVAAWRARRAELTARSAGRHLASAVEVLEALTDTQQAPALVLLPESHALAAAIPAPRREMAASAAALAATAASGRAQRDAEIAHLRWLWEAGSGPETGETPAVAAGQAA